MAARLHALKPVNHAALVGLLLILFLLAAVARAWVSDDAYITFRTVANFVEGRGLTWNPGERVQVYTHPLWMLLMSAAFALTREVHFTSMVLSLALGAAALWLFASRVSVSGAGAVFGLLALTLSKAYVDYTTSGLENALSHLLLVLFVWQLFRMPPYSLPRGLLAISLTASLGMLSRLDLALVFAPGLLMLAWRNRDRPSLIALAAGQLPLLLWEVFSLFYYGFPLPNTFYAKLNTGIQAAELAEQGVYYLFNALELDPLTPLLIVAGLLAAVQLRNRRAAALGLGILLYVAYIVRAGGDFMGGRFLTAPLLLAVALIGRLDFERLPPRLFYLPYALVLVLGLNAPHGVLDFRDPTLRLPPEEHVDRYGISDERLNYAPFTGLLQSTRQVRLPTHVWAFQGVRDAGKGRTLITKFAVGFYGFHAGPQVTVVDQLALADPLLARLPAARDLEWRVGHYVRALPDGYLRSLETGENRIKDPDLARYYDAIRLITRGPLLSRARLAAIFRLNTGGYDHLVDWEAYRYPEMVFQRLGQSVSTPVPDGRPADHPDNFAFGDSGFQLDLPQAARAAAVELSLSSDDDFRLVFMRGGSVLGSADVRRSEYPEGGLAVYVVGVPTGAAGGFDRIRVFPTLGDGHYSLGHARLLEGDGGQ